jgi:PAS domain S-box-containing protein
MRVEMSDSQSPGAKAVGLDAELITAPPQARLLATLLKDSSDAVIVHDFDGHIFAWNDGAERLYGHGEAEAMTMNALALVPEEARAQTRTLWERLRRGEQIDSWETCRLTRDGQVRDVWVTVTTLKDDNGLVAIANTERDITQRKQVEASLRETEKRLRLALNAANMGTWVWDSVADTVVWDARQFELFGIAPGEFRGDSGQILAQVHDGDRPRLEAAMARTLEHGAPFREEFRVPRPDGSYRWLIGLAQLLSDADGKPTQIIGVNFDITEAAEALRQSEGESRRLLDYHQAVMASMGEGLYTLDMHHAVTYVNPAAEALLGWKSSELLGRRMHHVIRYCCPDGSPLPIDDCAVFQSLLHGKVLRDHDDVFIRRDGSFFPVVYSCAPILSEGKAAGLVIVFRDMTERKRAEEKRRESEAHVQAILNTAADAIITIDSHGIIRSVNPASERLFGYAAAEMINDNVNLLMPSPYREEHDNYLTRYLQTGEKHIIGIGREIQGRRKDGSIFPMHVAVSQTEDGKFFTGIVRDMTEYKRLEREILEIAAQTQQRIGQDLHDSVAQELTALNLLAATLAETVDTDPAKAQQLVQWMTQGLKRSGQELRAVLRGLLPVTVDSNGLMAALTELANRTQQEGQVTCTFDCPKPVPVADNFTATHLYLIAQEAVHNAVKHGKPRNIRIGLHFNPCLVLRVRCDGVGMPAGPGGNEGLGLRIMRNRAAIIGAQLSIEPAEPTGVVVTCRLVSEGLEQKAGSPRR